MEKDLPLYQKIEDAQGASQMVYNRLDRHDEELNRKTDLDQFKTTISEIE